MADKVFNTVQSNRKVVADNYLSPGPRWPRAMVSKTTSPRAKAVTWHRSVTCFRPLLTSRTRWVSEGLGAGGAKMAGLFGGSKAIKIKSPVNRINFLVDEHFKTLQQVARWQLGLGKYLLSKIGISMQNKGVLEVDKIADKAGSYVFINGHAVGLASARLYGPRCQG